MGSDAKFIIDRAADMRAHRGTAESTWQQIAQVIRPIREDIQTRTRTEGDRRGRRILDGTAERALDNFAGGLYGMSTNPATQWLGFETDDDDLNQFQPVKEHLQRLSKIVLRSFGPGVSKFYAEVPETFLDVGAFGTGVFLSEEISKTGRIRDRARPLSEILIDVDGEGEVDTVYREFSMSARAAVQLWGDKMSSGVQRMAEKTPSSMVNLIHATFPNEGFRAGAFGDRGKAVASVYVEVENKHIITRGGFFELPYFVPRWTVAAGEIYGRGQGHKALADSLMMQEAARAVIRSAQRHADPTLLASDESVMDPVRAVPGRVIYGAINRRGDALVQPIANNGNQPLTWEQVRQIQDAVKDAFFFTLMQLVGRTGMTATEVLEVTQDRLRLMGPQIGRLQTEFLSPLVTRRFFMLSRAGALPPPPPELEGRPLEVRYESPMAKAVQAQEGTAILRFAEGAAQLAALDPAAIETINTDAAVRALGTAFGAPASVLRSQEEIALRRQQREAAEQGAQALQAGEMGANIVEQLARAQAAGGGG